MIVTAKQMFNLTDGRLSTSMEDIEKMLAFVANAKGLGTVSLIIVMRAIKNKNPDWFVEASKDLRNIKRIIGDDFEKLMKFYDSDHLLVKKTYTLTKL